MAQSQVLYTHVLLYQYGLKPRSERLAEKLRQPPLVLWVQFPVAAGFSHTKDVKNGSSFCLHGTHDEVGTTKHNWLARGQYNVTGWVSMWAYDMLSQWGSTIKRALSPTAPHLIDSITQD